MSNMIDSMLIGAIRISYINQEYQNKQTTDDSVITLDFKNKYICSSAWQSTISTMQLK